MNNIENVGNVSGLSLTKQKVKETGYSIVYLYRLGVTVVARMCLYRVAALDGTVCTVQYQRDDGFQTARFRSTESVVPFLQRLLRGNADPSYVEPSSPLDGEPVFRPEMDNTEKPTIEQATALLANNKKLREVADRLALPPGDVTKVLLRHIADRAREEARR